MSDERTLLQELATLWPALAAIIGWFARLEWRSRDNARAIVAVEGLMEKMDRRLSDVRREDLERAAESRRETNAALTRISEQIADLAKELREQGRHT